MPDPSFLFFSKKHRLALSILEYGLLNQAVFSVITGGIGTGKTTLLRQLLKQIDTNVSIGLISNTHESFGDLMQWVLMAFGLDYVNKSKAERYQIFVDYIIGQYAQNKRTVLIVDESQNLSAQTLEELRMLSNINADKDQLLQVILVGQAELRETLQRSDLIQFAQRITVDYHLEPLSKDEVFAYIAHRIQVAGGHVELFSKEVADYLFEQTLGVPRIINLLCDTALVYAYAEQADRVSLALMSDVVEEKRKGGLFPRSESTIKKVADETPAPAIQPEPAQTAAVEEDLPALPENAPRVFLLSSLASHRTYLHRLLRASGIHLLQASAWNHRIEKQISELNPDLLLIDFDEVIQMHYDKLEQLAARLHIPTLFNECLPNEGLFDQEDQQCGQQLAARITTLVNNAKMRI